MRTRATGQRRWVTVLWRWLLLLRLTGFDGLGGRRREKDRDVGLLVLVGAGGESGASRHGRGGRFCWRVRIGASIDGRSGGGGEVRHCAVRHGELQHGLWGAWGGFVQLCAWVTTVSWVSWPCCCGTIGVVTSGGMSAGSWSSGSGFGVTAPDSEDIQASSSERHRLPQRRTVFRCRGRWCSGVARRAAG